MTNKFAQSGEYEQAVKWAVSLNPQHDLGRALSWPLENWTRKAPDAVGAWLNEQPAGTRKDKALDQFASTLTSQDAPSAAAWAASIGDDTLRGKRVKAVVGTWAKKDAAATRAWVAAQPFAAAQQQDLLTEVERVAK